MRIHGGLIVLVATFFFSGVAGAQTQEEAAPAVNQEDQNIISLESRSTEQSAALAKGLEEVSKVGSSLDEAQSQVNGAQVRSQELAGQRQDLKGQLTVQKQTFEESKSGYEKQAEAAYKGKNLEGATAMLGSVVGGKGDIADLADGRIARVLSQGKQNLNEYRDSKQRLENTERQISQKKTAYNNSVKEKRQRAEKLHVREQELEASVSRIRGGRSATDSRIRSLRKAEKRRILSTRAATGGPTVQRQLELKIAQQDIIARPVKQISKKQYKRLYKKSAKKYGFGGEWYILAAVGKVESDHGENMGPSSAGAMGPMQFMPSTWETSGVDGNGDGVANVMDPRDAIPAAARYLKTGGAPEDWYAALFSYNHADWYVKKVLGVSEGYRRLADDDRVGPYT